MKKLFLSILFLSLIGLGCSTIQYGEVKYTRLGSQGAFLVTKTGDDFSIDFKGVRTEMDSLAETLAPLIDSMIKARTGQ